jgi:hypothetical protein
MSDPIPTPGGTRAWLPFTLGGVAAFARATFVRTIAAALALAVIDALLVFGAFDLGWLPVIDDAVNALPDTGQIRARALQWTDESPRVLAVSPLLQIVVDVEGAGAFGDETDLRVELRQADLRLCGWLGCWTKPYPAGWIIAMNRPELVPLWGAWRPFVLWGVLLGVIVFLLVSWGALATLGAIPLRLAAFYADREVTLAGCWRMIVAALQPGGLFLGTAIFFYGVRRLNVIELMVCFVVHFLIGIIWVAVSARGLPRVVAPVAP